MLGLDAVSLPFIKENLGRLPVIASLLKSGGRLASPLGAAGDGPDRFNVMSQPTPANLERLAGLLGSGTLRVPIQQRFGLEQTNEAVQALLGTHTQGKLGVTIA